MTTATSDFLPTSHHISDLQDDTEEKASLVVRDDTIDSTIRPQQDPRSRIRRRKTKASRSRVCCAVSSTKLRLLRLVAILALIIVVSVVVVAVQKVRLKVATGRGIMTGINIGNSFKDSSISSMMRIVSMNIAGCKSSAMAPAGWTLTDQVQELVKKLLLSDPDAIFLQECPSKEWAARTFPQYAFAGARRTHAGFTSLLLKPKLIPEPVALNSDIPAVMVKVQIGIKQFALASVHLAPFETGSGERQGQVRGLLNAAGSLGLLFAGDCNMRDTEDEIMEETLQMTDVWKEAGMEETTRYSWDTEDHEDSFNQYYGKSTRQYRRRYDRIYAHNATVGTASFYLIANSPIGTSTNHFLSDHFGIAAEFHIS